MQSLLLLLLLPTLTLSDGIPKHLKLKLKHVKSFKELADTVSLVYHPTSPARSRMAQHTPSAAAMRSNAHRQPVRINGASIFGGTHQSKMRGMALHDEQQHVEHEVDDETREHMKVFNSIRQGNDTCKLQSVCVPVPVDNDNPLIVVYPRCYEVMRCVGSCCDSEESCHPHSTRELSKPIVEMIYKGHDRFDINQMRNITMVEHMSCSCKNCGTEVKQCAPGYTLGPSCECECANQGEKRECTGNPYLVTSRAHVIASNENNGFVASDNKHDSTNIDQGQSLGTEDDVRQPTEPSEPQPSQDSAQTRLPETKESIYDPYSTGGDSTQSSFAQAPPLPQADEEAPAQRHSRTHKHKARHQKHHRGTFDVDG